ncbi:MAG: FkbM family methyltransferase [Gammaproteobacteria bacterium]
MGKSLAAAIAKIICKHLTPAGRAKVVRDSFSMSDLYMNLPKHQLIDLIFGAAANRTNAASLVLAGDQGIIEGSPKDRVIFYTYAQTGSWSSSFQSELIDRFFIHGKGTFLDIGANIGLTAIPAAIRHGIQCFAFEPDPVNFQLLKRNIERNKVADRITIFNVALHDTQGVLDFELSENNWGDHRLRIPGQMASVTPSFNETERHVVNVQAIPLDMTLDSRELIRPIFLKIDTQGAEVTVLRGARETLKSVDLLVVEFSPYHLGRMGADVADFIKEIEGWPYGMILSFDSTTVAGAAYIGQFLPIEKVTEILYSLAKSQSPDNYVDVVLSRQPNICPDI